MIKKILFICTGNTCRSPMAKAFADDIIKTEGLDLKTESAGLSTIPFLPASQNSISSVSAYGIHLRKHKTKAFSHELGRDADLILVMTQAHKQALVKSFPEFKNKIHTLKNTDVSDPYGGNLQVYKNSAEEIKEAVIDVIKKIKMSE